MILLTKELKSKLLKNGDAQNRAACADKSIDHMPVVKLFTPDAQCTWLLTEIDPGQPDIAFGLCDLGIGSPELGYVSLTELAALRGRMGLPVERDRHFEADKPISEYAREARNSQYISA